MPGLTTTWPGIVRIGFGMTLACIQPPDSATTRSQGGVSRSTTTATPSSPSTTQPLPSSLPDPLYNAERSSQPGVEERRIDPTLIPRPTGPAVKPDEYEKFPRLPRSEFLPEPPSNSDRKRTENDPATRPLLLDELLTSVDQSYPPLLMLRAERGVAGGELIASYGIFDLGLEASARNWVLGAYQRYIQDVRLTQFTPINGTKLFAGYRLGQGNFPSYYGYDQTLGGGEFALGFDQPLLRDRFIDDKRAKVLQLGLERRKVEPEVMRGRIEFFREATFTYLEWLAAAYRFRIRETLLEVAQERQKALVRQAELGLIAQNYDIPDNQRVILTRQASLVKERQKFQEKAIELSLFLRDSYGLPILAEGERVPPRFTPPMPPVVDRINEDLQGALRLRPELAALSLELQKKGVDLQQAFNLLQPSLNLYVAAHQDIGAQPRYPQSDLQPFSLQTSLLFDVPLQRRQARGKIQAAQSSIYQARQKIVFTQNKIQTEVQKAMVGLENAYEIYLRAREGVDVARQVEIAELRRLYLGSSSILQVNLRELATVDAQILTIDAEADFYRSWADYRAALALDAMPGGTSIVTTPLAVPFSPNTPPPASGRPVPTNPASPARDSNSQPDYPPLPEEDPTPLPETVNRPNPR